MPKDALTSYEELAATFAALPLLLREARRARGLTMEAAAAQIGCSRSTVHRIENGGDCWLSHVVAILRWLDLRPRWKEAA